MKAKLTVSDSKTLFHEQFPYVIPSLYKRIVDEMLVELNLLNHQNEFTQDIYFCVGLTETFNELTNGYEPKEHLTKLFNALCISTDFIPDDIKEKSSKALKQHEGKDTKEIFDLIIKNNSTKNYYSRIFILGIYKILSLANDFKDEEDISKIKILSDISSKLELPLTRAEKDIGMYKSNIKKFEAAKELLRETILNEREKRKK